MKNRRKEQIKEVFAAPAPKRRREFFRKIETQPMKEYKIILQQFQYISKISWVAALAVLFTAFYMKRFYSDESLGAILALMPFLALTNVFEGMRSKCYGMAELEMSCRFSLKSITLIRMEIVGIENLLVGIALAVLLNKNLFISVIYLFVPYLLTTYGCLLFSRKNTDREQVYFFTGIALFVSWVMLVTPRTARIYQAQYVWVWFLAVVVLGAVVLREYRSMLGKLQV